MLGIESGVKLEQCTDTVGVFEAIESSGDRAPRGGPLLECVRTHDVLEIPDGSLITRFVGLFEIGRRHVASLEPIQDPSQPVWCFTGLDSIHEYVKIEVALDARLLMTIQAPGLDERPQWDLLDRLTRKQHQKAGNQDHGVEPSALRTPIQWTGGHWTEFEA